MLNSVSLAHISAKAVVYHTQRAAVYIASPRSNIVGLTNESKTMPMSFTSEPITKLPAIQSSEAAVPWNESNTRLFVRCDGCDSQRAIRMSLWTEIECSDWNLGHRIGSEVNESFVSILTDELTEMNSVLLMYRTEQD